MCSSPVHGPVQGLAAPRQRPIGADESFEHLTRKEKGKTIKKQIITPQISSLTESCRTQIYLTPLEPADLPQLIPAPAEAISSPRKVFFLEEVPL